MSQGTSEVMRYSLHYGLALGMFVLNGHQSSPLCGSLCVLPDKGGRRNDHTLFASWNLFRHPVACLLCHTASPRQDQGQRQFPNKRTGAKVDKRCLPCRSVSVVGVV